MKKYIVEFKNGTKKTIKSKDMNKIKAYIKENFQDITKLKEAAADTDTILANLEQGLSDLMDKIIPDAQALVKADSDKRGELRKEMYDLLNRTAKAAISAF